MADDQLSNADRKAAREALLDSGLSRLGHSGWKPVQKTVVKNVMRKVDVLAVMPTGSGYVVRIIKFCALTPCIANCAAR